MSAGDMRKIAETLGTILSADPSENQKLLFDQYLELAHQHGYPEKVINYPIQRYNGRTLVHIAADRGLQDYLEVLLKNGGNPNKISSLPDLCQTPLHLAAFQGYAKCLEILIKYGAQIRMQNSHRTTPVDLVRGKAKCEKVIQQAIDKIEVPNRTNDQLQRVMDLHRLLDERNIDENSFISIYCQLTDVETDLSCRYTDWFQQTLLYRAVDKQQVGVVKFLLQKSPNQPLSNLGNGDAPLVAACRHDNFLLVDILLRHSPQLLFVADEQNHLSPLHVSCSRGGEKGLRIVKFILETVQALYNEKLSDRDLNMTDKIGRTPLYNACYHGHLNIVELLLDFMRENPSKIDINSEEKMRRTPLHAAVAAPKHSKEIVELLLRNSSLNVNAEGYPSSRAQKFLRKILERKRSSVATPYLIRSPTSPREITGPDLTDTSSSCDTPITICSIISDDFDTEIGITKPKEPEFGSPIQIQPVLQSVHVAPQPVSPTSSIGVYRSPRGHLEVSESPNHDHTHFHNLLLTPLAEACIFRNKDIVELLIKHGAIDSNGYACQLSYIIQRPSLAHLVLARQCHLESDLVDDKTPQSDDVPLYSLQWHEKHLQSIEGKWLTSPLYSFALGPMLEMGSLQCQPITFTEIDYTSIHTVKLQKNNLRTVPVELFHLPNVREINLSQNELISLPGTDSHTSDCLNVWKCDQLTSLNLASNQLISIPPVLWCSESLERVTISANKLTSLLSVDLPDDAEFSASLTNIDLSNNCLRVVEDFLFLLPQLAKLNLSQNQLVSLPDTLWECETLQELNASHNQLSSLPKCNQDDWTESSTFATKSAAPGILDLASTVHDARATLVDDFTSQSFHGSGGTGGGLLQSWRRSKSKRPKKSSAKEAEGFQIHQIQDRLEQPNEMILEVCDYSVLTRLNLSHNRFIEFPRGLPCLAPNLTELDISKNLIQSIDIVYLPQSIRKLTAKDCKLERLGNTLTNKQLKVVQKQCCNDPEATVCFHRSHSQLQYLQTLQLSGNCFKRFQLVKCELKRGTKDPTENEKEYLPNCSILNLLYPSLEGLDLSRNCLVDTFNPNIGRQLQLKWIRLGSNVELKKLPLEIALLKNLRKLTEINIDNLPNLIEPPKDYQGAKVQASQLLTYMRSLLKESVPYRTLKLFFIGCGKRGKTTLLRRLRERQAGETERTEGIDIEEWSCRGAKKRMFRQNQEPIQFLAWDFAGQEVYQVTHQCFYSRRALYLALFRLSDGIEGVNELEPWLRNVQLRAPGCIVIVIGTHFDKVTEAEAQKLEDLVKDKYKGSNLYPKIVGCIAVSCVSKFRNNIDKLRKYIYNVAIHLHVSPADGITLDFKPDANEHSPHALLQQQIPKSFLTLQEQVSELVKHLQELEKPPFLHAEEFRNHFQKLFVDEEEMNEAVNYLTLQGTLLHFEDYGLRNLYFLDPQWLAKLMAQLISPSSAENIKLINGRLEISSLFQNDLFPNHDKAISDSYLQLLQKFEVALCIGGEEVVIPSLLPEEGQYPKPNDSLSDVDLLSGHEICYQPPLRRIWFSNYIPDGFWPRLICRILNDQQITSVLSYYAIGHTHLGWTCWRSGLVFASRGRTLLMVRLVSNPVNSWATNAGQTLNSMNSKFRIETHIYVPEMITALQELNLHESFFISEEEEEKMPTPNKVAGHATRLMVSIGNHISFLSSWFHGILEHSSGYVPCWKCFGGVKRESDMMKFDKNVHVIFVDVGGASCSCFSFQSCIVPFCANGEIKCPYHGDLKAVHTAPDLAFWDLVTNSNEMENPSSLEIGNEILGKGGYGFVCKGELKEAAGTKSDVAVKVFLANMEGKMDSSSLPDLLKEAKDPRQLPHAYKEIRQEVIFLATLKHQNITRLVGVKTSPVFCLLLELAPQKSLRNILKVYHSQKLLMEPLTFKQCAKQIADGLNYLHSHQIVHLDMKSPNVLVWEFPLPTLTRQERIEQAGNVWLKIADYGISQVSPSLMMKVSSPQAGTPGYMAPELFNSTGQEIFSTKVDVFAYGMTLYEILSLQGPFQKLDAAKRNHEIIDGKRPPIGSKEKRTPLLLQDLMRLCWDKDPSLRPDMKQCLQWTSCIEFERLRTQLTLDSCLAVSCACVSRVEPRHESEWMEKREAGSNIRTEMNGSLLSREEIERFGLNMEIVKCEDERLEIEESIKKSHLVNETDGDEEPDGRSLETSRDKETDTNNKTEPNKSTSSSTLLATTALTTSLLAKETEHEQLKGEQAYSQVWMCGRDQKKGLLSVFIFPDRQKTVSRFFGYVGKEEEIQGLCPVRNAIWMGTSRGSLRIIHAPSLAVKFSGKLSVDAAAILKILHIEEENCVLVSLTSSEILSLHDRLIGRPCSLVKEQIISTDQREGCGPVYDLVKVVVGGALQVWGTMDNNTLLLMEKINGGEWQTSYYYLEPYSHHMKVCSHIVWCSFVNEEGESCDHLWVSYRSKGGIVCFDVKEKKQRGHINCTERLKTDQDQAQQVTALLAQGRRLYVGTLSGTVAVFDSQSFGLITHFSWHEGKVRYLLLLPEQVKACVCAEVPFGGEDEREKERQISKSRLKPSSQTNTCCIPNVHANLSLVASIGNGRFKLATAADTSSSISSSSSSNSSNKSDSPVQNRRRTTWMPQNNEDINLLIWHS